jgi:hypothetical protein
MDLREGRCAHTPSSLTACQKRSYTRAASCSYGPKMRGEWAGNRQIRAFLRFVSSNEVLSQLPSRRSITRLGRAADAGQPPESQRSAYTRSQGPSARAVSLVMVCQAAKRSSDAQMYLDQLCAMDPGIARAHGLAQAFLAMVRERRGQALEAWMAEATHSNIPELARFARGLQDDLTAIKAGLSLAWSHGVTEGHVHRLKLVQRQGDGRAGFALLPQRVSSRRSRHASGAPRVRPFPP